MQVEELLDRATALETEPGYDPASRALPDSSKHSHTSTRAISPGTWRSP
ncbi:MAG TPA: hypothetical protein VM282_13135 [Acidimicrobiales bacterium]|nr:hypothetical protein [Acidimicrobiales bacterium]